MPVRHTSKRTSTIASTGCCINIIFFPHPTRSYRRGLRHIRRERMPNTHQLSGPGRLLHFSGWVTLRALAAPLSPATSLFIL